QRIAGDHAQQHRGAGPFGAPVARRVAVPDEGAADEDPRLHLHLAQRRGLKTAAPEAPVRRRHFLQAGAGAALAALAPGLTRAATPADGRFDFWFTRLMYESGDWDVDQRMPSTVLDALLQYTTLRVDPREHVLPLADPRVLEA